MKKDHVVLTTIREPHVLTDLRDNAKRFGHLDSTVCWVIGDVKTPQTVADLCQRVSAAGLDARYVDIDSQDEWGKSCPEFYALMPRNNESRRNIGYLMALEAGCERLISIDDDNFPTDDDFIGGHARTGGHVDGNLTEDASGYHNICEHLDVRPARPIFPRGYPFKLRDSRNCSKLKPAPADAIVGVTAGLWLKEPDVDATTWLNGKVQAIRYTAADNVVLHQNTWSPINTQNTSVVRELIPAFLCVPMGFKFAEGSIERYGDIWAGYFVQALMAGSAYHVSFGEPIVEHRRNPHDYLEDLRHEMWGMLLTDWLLTELRTAFRPASSQNRGPRAGVGRVSAGSDLQAPALVSGCLWGFPRVHLKGTERLG